DDLEAGIDQVDQEEPDSGKRDDIEPAGRQKAVDEERDGDRKGQYQQARPHGAAEVERKQGAMRAAVGGKSLKVTRHRHQEKAFSTTSIVKTLEYPVS